MQEVFKMKKFWIIFISVAGGLMVLAGAITTLLIIREKRRRDDEELEQYLDGAIQ